MHQPFFKAITTHHKARPPTHRALKSYLDLIFRDFQLIILIIRSLFWLSRFQNQNCPIFYSSITHSQNWSNFIEYKTANSKSIMSICLLRCPDHLWFLYTLCYRHLFGYSTPRSAFHSQLWFIQFIWHLFNPSDN